MLSNPIGRLRLIGLIEGISFLVLLFVAMPLKYAAGIPEAVKYVGWAHGVLFVLFILALLQASAETDWSLRKMAGAFIASVVPFGTFVLDRQLKRDEAALLAAPEARPT
jgi:integral membrane protein